MQTPELLTRIKKAFGLAPKAKPAYAYKAKEYREAMHLAAKIAANEDITYAEMAYPLLCLSHTPEDVEAMPLGDTKAVAAVMQEQLTSLPDYTGSAIPRTLFGLPFPQTLDAFRMTVTSGELAMMDAMMRQMQADAPIDKAIALVEVWLTHRLEDAPVVREFSGVVGCAPAADVLPAGFFLRSAFKNV